MIISAWPLVVVVVVAVVVCSIAAPWAVPVATVAVVLLSVAEAVCGSALVGEACVKWVALWWCVAASVADAVGIESVTFGCTAAGVSVVVTDREDWVWAGDDVVELDELVFELEMGPTMALVMLATGSGVLIIIVVVVIVCVFGLKMPVDQAGMDCE